MAGDNDTKFKPQQILNRVFDEDNNLLNLGGGVSLIPYDYASRELTNSTTVTWTFKEGGVNGTVLNTVVVVYTDSTLETISSITKT